MKKTSSDKGKSKDNINQIDNHINYFNKILKNIDNKEFQKLKIIYKTEISMEFNDFDEQIISRQTNPDKIEDKLNNNDSLSWVEFLENKVLYFALKNLKIQDLIILDMWTRQGYSQKEIAEIFDSTEKAVNIRIDRIRRKIIKKFEKR